MAGHMVVANAQFLVDVFPGITSMREDSWAVTMAFFAQDILDVGGFRLDLGPESGTPTDEDTDFQMRPLANGSAVVYVEDAVVWHYVPMERCTQEWAIQRHYRNCLGKVLISKELPRVSRRILGLPLGYWKYMVQLYLGRFLAENLAFIIPDKRMRFRVRRWAAGVRGRLEGIRRNVSGTANG